MEKCLLNKYFQYKFNFMELWIIIYNREEERELRKLKKLEKVKISFLLRMHIIRDKKFFLQVLQMTSINILINEY